MRSKKLKKAIAFEDSNGKMYVADRSGNMYAVVDKVDNNTREKIEKEMQLKCTYPARCDKSTPDGMCKNSDLKCSYRKEQSNK